MLYALISYPWAGIAEFLQGHGDRMNFYAPAEEIREDGAPAKPNMSVVDACLNGVIYSAYLALHYFRKNSNKSGKIVSTSSMCGLYPGDGIPLYVAAKHGVCRAMKFNHKPHKLITAQVVGLTRALGQRLQKLGTPVTVNCLCPGKTMPDLPKAHLPPSTSTVLTRTSTNRSSRYRPHNTNARPVLRTKHHHTSQHDRPRCRRFSQ